MSEIAIVALFILVFEFWSVTHYLAKMVRELKEMNKTLDFINKHVFDIKEPSAERHQMLMGAIREAQSFALGGRVHR